MRKNQYLTIISLAVILAFTFLNCNPCASAQEAGKEEESLFVAKKAFEDGFYDVSLGLLERFIKAYPNSQKVAEANFFIGRCNFAQNKYLDALNKFEELLKDSRAKDFKEALYYWIAEVHFKGNGFSKAGEYYKKIIEEFPKSSYVPVAYYSLGWCLFQERDYSGAMENFKIAEEKYPKEPQAQDASFKIIECLYNLKDYSGLKERANSYLKIYAKDPVRLSYLYFYAAEADYYLNNFNAAVDEYSKVIAATSDIKLQAISKLGLGWSSLKSKRYKEAESALYEIRAEDLEGQGKDALLLAKAELMVETNRVNEAKNIYDELIAATSEPQVLVQAFIGKADALYNLTDYEGAIKVYKEALVKTQPETASSELTDKLHYSLAWAYLKQGEFKEAIKEFQKIARGSADKIIKVSALCQIGDAYQDSGDYRKAQETYDEILKDYPDSSYGDYVQYQLGLIQLKNSNYDSAIMSFITLKRNYPQSKLLDDATYALALSYFQKQDYNSSRDVLEKFQAEFKDSSLRPQALYLLGTSLFNQAKFAEAIEVFREVVRQFNQDRELAQKAEYEIADCFYQMGNEKEAMNLFKALRSKYPDSSLTPEIMWWLGEYYYRNNDLVLARRYFSSLIQDFPRSNLVADAYYALGTSFEDESKHQEAVENFKKVIEQGSSDLSGQAAAAIADIYVKQNKSDSALQAYKDIVRDYPNLASLIYPKMAELFFKTGNYNEALDLYSKSLDLVPVKEMPVIQFKIAEAIEARGDLNQATEEYLKVTYLYSENTALATKALLRVAKIYEGKEAFKEADNIYKRIVSMNVEEAKYAQERIDWIKAHVR